MTTVAHAYTKYDITPNLQRHMLEVTGVVRKILDAWKGPEVNKEALITACLFHDMGNIVKFNFDRPITIKDKEPIDTRYWRDIQKKYWAKYGKEEYAATFAINKELGVDTAAQMILEDQHALGNDGGVVDCKSWEIKLFFYGDMRVSPKGVVPLAERLGDIYKRYLLKDDELAYCFELEKQIKQQCDISLESITEEAIEPFFADFLARSV